MTVIFHCYRKKFSFKISTYMLELYNDRLLDLFNTDHKSTVSSCSGIMIGMSTCVGVLCVLN